MKKTDLKFFFYLCIFFLSRIAQPLSLEGYSTQSSGKITIYHHPADSSLASQTSLFLNNTIREILFDFEIEIDDSFRVIIAPTRKEFSKFRGQLPNWTQAFAVPSQQLFIVKSARWDQNRESYYSVLSHELIHLVLFKLVGNRHVPRWLDEGLATFYSKEQRWATLTTLSKAALTRSFIPFSEIDNVFEFNRLEAELAYQQCYSIIDYLYRIYDTESMRIILKTIRQGNDLDTAFRTATGSSFQEFEKEWQNWAAVEYKWYWLSETDTYIWFFIFLLAVVAITVVKYRNRKKISEWEETELEEDLPPTFPEPD